MEKMLISYSKQFSVEMDHGPVLWKISPTEPLPHPDTSCVRPPPLTPVKKNCQNLHQAAEPEHPG